MVPEPTATVSDVDQPGGGSPPEQTSRIPELDGLRGIAIALVVVFHSFYFNPGPEHHTAGVIRTAYVFMEHFFALGWTGVDLFFVLSGFLIGGILLDVRGSPRYFKTFYARRLFRIVPIYYFWIGLYLLFAAFSGELLARAKLAAGLFLFLQNFGFKYPTALADAWFLPAWSLAVEEQFYLIAPFVIRLVSPRRLFGLIGAVILAAPLLRVWVLYHVPQVDASLPLAYTLMPCRADALAVGIMAALLWRKVGFRIWLTAHVKALYLTTAVFFAGFIALGARYPAAGALPMQTIGYTWIAILYGLVMVSAMTSSAGPIAVIARAYWLREIGRVSYCLYLIHDAVRFGAALLIRSIMVHPPSWELVAGNGVAAIVSYLLARLSWTYFEYPLLRRGHAFKY